MEGLFAIVMVIVVVVNAIASAIKQAKQAQEAAEQRKKRQASKPPGLKRRPLPGPDRQVAPPAGGRPQMRPASRPRPDRSEELPAPPPLTLPVAPVDAPPTREPNWLDTLQEMLEGELPPLPRPRPSVPTKPRTDPRPRVTPPVLVAPPQKPFAISEAPLAATASLRQDMDSREPSLVHSLSFRGADIRRAIVYAVILGPPRAYQPWRIPGGRGSHGP